MAESSLSRSGAAGGGGGGGGSYSNLQEDTTPSEDELKSAEWEARLASGDLPEDFLQVTEPQAVRGGATRKMASNHGFEPEVANLIDVPSGEEGAMALPSAAAAAGASATSPRRAALAAAAANDSGAIGASPATNPSEASLPPRRTLAEADSPVEEKGEKPSSIKGDQRRFMSTEEQDRAMALALQEQLNLEDGGGGDPGMAYQAGAFGQMVAAPATMIGRLTGNEKLNYS
jgi:hypothetical protein